MKILGIGVDIVENSRINKLLKNKLFIKRIFSNSEILIATKISELENIRLIKSLLFNDLSILEFSTISTPMPNIFISMYWKFF